MRARLAAFILIASVLAPVSARASGRYLPPCESTWTAEKTADDECGAFVDFRVAQLSYVYRLPVAIEPSTSASPEQRLSGQSWFIGAGASSGYLFPGHLGVRLLDFDGWFSPGHPYLGDRDGGLFTAIFGVDVSGILFHGRARTESGSWSYLVGLSPNLAMASLNGSRSDPEGASTAWYLGARTNVRGCYGASFHVCAELTANLFQFGRALDGVGVALTLGFKK